MLMGRSSLLELHPQLHRSVQMSEYVSEGVTRATTPYKRDCSHVGLLGEEVVDSFVCVFD